MVKKVPELTLDCRLEIINFAAEEAVFEEKPRASARTLTKNNTYTPPVELQSPSNVNRYRRLLRADCILAMDTSGFPPIDAAVVLIRACWAVGLLRDCGVSPSNVNPADIAMLVTVPALLLYD